MTMKVPFVDLATQFESIREELMPRVERVFAKAAFIGGDEVNEFERRYAEYVGARHCIGVANGTDALIIALRALGIGPGDEVITHANTFFATIEAVYAVGAKPVLVDHNPDTYMIDVNALESALTSRTRVVIPVHLYGHPAPMDEILAFAKKHDLKVVADCAQAHGATYKGRPLGNLGDIVCYSMYPGKNLGAYGDAGAITTDSDELAESIRVLSQHGSRVKYHHLVSGYNSRLDNVQAAVLNVKLNHLQKWTEQRQAVAAQYDEMLRGVPVGLPTEARECTHVYHLYVVRVNDRESVIEALKADGVGTGIHYPIPLHLQPACSSLGYAAGAFPTTEKYAPQLLSLPMYPEMTNDQVSSVVSSLLRAIGV